MISFFDKEENIVGKEEKMLGIFFSHNVFKSSLFQDC